MATITLKNLAPFASSTNLQLFLRKLDDTLINTGGDTGVSVGVGMFAWTVAETIPNENVAARIYEGSTETEANNIIDSILYAGQTEIGQEAASGGDATLAKQEEILDAIDTYIASVTAVDGSSGTIVGFPSSLIIGNSYTADGNNDIHVFIRDENDDPITSVGTHDFTDPDFSCDLIITNSGNAGRVRATVTYVDPGVAESYLKVEIPLSESSRAATGAATMQCTLKWNGVAKTIATQTVTWVARI